MLYCLTFLYCPMYVNVRSDCHFFLFSIVLPKFQRRTTSSWDRSVKVYTPIPLGIKTSILRSPDDNSTLDCNERQFSFNIHNFCYSMTRIYLALFGGRFFHWFCMIVSLQHAGDVYGGRLRLFGRWTRVSFCWMKALYRAHDCFSMWFYKYI